MDRRINDFTSTLLDSWAQRHTNFIGELAGIVSQSLFTWQTHRFAVASDYARVFELVEGLTDAESLKMRHAGYVRARKILEKHATAVEQLAKRLITHKRVTLD